MIITVFGAAFLFSGSALSTSALIGTYALALLAATNLPMTMLYSTIAYLDDGSIWFYDLPLGSGTHVFPSLWWVFIIIYLLAALFLYWRCIVNVRRIPKR